MGLFLRILAWRKSMFAQMLVLTAIFLSWGVYAFVIRPLSNLPAPVLTRPPLQSTEDALRTKLYQFTSTIRDDPSGAPDITKDDLIRQVRARNPQFRFYVQVGDQAFGDAPPALFRRFGFDQLEHIHHSINDPVICSQGEKIIKRGATDDFASFRMCDRLSYFEYRNLRHPVLVEQEPPTPVRRKWFVAFSGNFLLAAGGVFLIFAVIFAAHMLSIRRVAKLARSIDPQRLDATLPEKGVATEILPLVRAVNHLIGQVEAAQRRATFFLSAAAHEMRTPLTVLRTRLELMEDGREKDKLVGDVQRLTRLVNQLLTLMSIGNRRDVTGFVDLVASARKVLTDRAPLAKRAEVVLRLESAMPAFEVPGDAALVGSAIANLVDNAISFAPPGSAVELRVDEEGTITVRDHGPGLGNFDPATLFEPFVRPVTKRRGYGLGLAIVHAIVQLHGGRVQASQADGGGALFTVRFPS